MNAFDLAPEPRHRPELVPPASILEARAARDGLAVLLGRERLAAADFLLALADFDRRRCWERLGHASLFAFLTRELGLSRGGAFFRLTAARLAQRFPEVIEPLRDGRLCVTSVVELARVLTPENRAEVLPLFFGCSSREAREVAAALDPHPNPPMRAVVTTLPLVSPASAGSGAAPGAAPRPGGAGDAGGPGPDLSACGGATGGAALTPAAAGGSLVTPGGDDAPPPAPGGVAPPHGAVRSTEPPPGGWSALRTEVRPLTAQLRRLHVTVTDRFLEKVSAAQDGLSHVQPGATTEQVLEAALDLLLEKQARARALVKRPRAARGPATRPAAARGASPAQVEPPPAETAGGFARRPATGPAGGPATGSAGGPAEGRPAAPLETSAQARSTETGKGAPPAPSRPRPRRPHIPAAIERAVRLRDDDRCQAPLDGGGVCGSTFRVQLDHVVPLALGGETSVANLRCACQLHNLRAAVEALGASAMRSWRGEQRRRWRRSKPG